MKQEKENDNEHFDIFIRAKVFLLIGSSAFCLRF